MTLLNRKWYHQILLLSLMFFATLGYAQEDCANGIDDDGDGLIDIQDEEDCFCGDAIYAEVVGDFEEFTCCPSSGTTPANPGDGIDCLDGGWGAPNGATPDYFNTCDFIGGDILPPIPMPIPSGEGAIGIGSRVGYYENIGVCLDNSMINGETYNLSFYIGFNAFSIYSSDLNVTINIYGTEDCDNFPIFGSNDCLSFNAEWDLIAGIPVSGIANDSWLYVETTFTSNMNAEAIAFGLECNVTTLQYHFLDDININGNFLVPNIEEGIVSYGNCIDGITVELPNSAGPEFQWYLDGVAIPGATTNPYLITDATAEGEYQVMVINGGSCSLSTPIDIQIEPDAIEIVGNVTEIQCILNDDGMIDISTNSPNDPYQFDWSNGTTFEDIINGGPGTYTVTVTDDHGCFGTESFVIQQPTYIEAMVSGDCINGVFISIEEFPGASYQWYLDGNLIPGAVLNPYQVPSDFPGIYHVIASDGPICKVSSPLNVDIDLEVLDIEGEVEDLLCFDTLTGSIDIEVNDMNSPLTYNWSNGEDTEDISGLSTGTYTVEVIDANGCFGVMGFTVDGPDQFINTLTVVQPDMGNPGSASIASSGGVEPYTYAWNNGFDQSIDENLPAGSYSITVTDGNGCIEIFDFEITSDYIVIATSIDESCSNACDGSILLTVDGEDSDYSVLWDSSVISGFNPTQVCAGMYAYTVTNSEGSPYIGTVTINAPAEIIISAEYEDTICANTIDLDISLLVSGGTSPFSYLWNTGSTNDTLFGVGVGTYIVEIIDSLGCIASDTFEIESLPAIDLQFAIEPTGCNGEEIGAIDMTINNVIAPYNILWSNDSITEDLIDLGDGWYFVTVTDGNGCLAIDSAYVNSNSGISVNDNIVPVNCAGEDNGYISLEVSGGLAPYEIEWDNGADSIYIENLSPGFYEVTILDNAGCSWSQNYEIILNSNIDIASQTVDNECYGEAFGSIELTVNNVFTSYTINWEDGSSDTDRYNLLAGSYYFTLIDSFGCEYLDSFIISEGLEINYQSIISEPDCNGTDGSISISPNTGAFPFSYQWSNGGNSNQINDLISGAYFLTTTDDNGCIKLDTFILSENSDIMVSETIIQNACYGESEGSIDLDISGGILPYTISWSNGENTALINNLSSGDYTAIIEDGNGCNATYIYEISEPDSLQIEDLVELPLCHDELGIINVQGSGGIQLYTFNWATGETDPTINITSGNIYTVTITDMNQCTKSKTYIIDDITEIEVITTSIVDPTSSNNDGSITIDVSGGTSPHTTSWDNGQTGLMAINLGFGFHTATVVDANGCTQTITVELSNDTLSASGLITDNLCFGDCNGQIILTIEGGTEPYVINWSDGQSGINAESLCNGEYQASIIDGLGEEFETEIFLISSPNDIIIEEQVYNISCVGVDDGAISINSEGGANPIDYNWSNSMIGDSIGNLSSGQYSVTVMDINGCSKSEMFTIEDIQLIDIDVEVLPFDCENPNGTIILKGENTYDYSYYLNGAIIEPNDQNEIENLPSGIYQFSYAINETCIIDVETVDIQEQLSNDFQISSTEFTVIEGDEVFISLDFNQDSLLSYFTIDWQILNPSNCIFLNSHEQCTEISVLAQESEIVQVVITDNVDGCETILEAKIIVDDNETKIFFPNVFSPNDDGVNDEFTITSNDTEVFIESMQIFDRWGSMVYSQRNTDLQNLLFWNGEFRGKKVAPNVFVYRIEYKDRTGETKFLFGELAVVY